MHILVLGKGCSRCEQLYKNTLEAIKSLNISADAEHITDIAVIAKYGILQTPALVVDDKVVSYSQVLSPEEIIKLIS